jgi:SEC-C motif-containing protein
MKCPCESQTDFSSCCEAFLTGEAKPKTAEQLMRSRYTAYTLANIDYIKKTMAPEHLASFDEQGTRRWAEDSKWLGLKILSTEQGGRDDSKGVVVFTASFEQNGQKQEHHERAYFRKSDAGTWCFVDGEAPPQAHQKPIVREGPKVGRNDPCPCGSGQKFKRCCG